MTSQPPSLPPPEGTPPPEGDKVPDPERTSSGLTGTRPVPQGIHHVESNPQGKRLAILTLSALGVVYGDIGTSPLYAIKEIFKPEYGLSPTPANVLGTLSLIVWSLLLVVTVKYVRYILRADNRGEGGVLALLALILHRLHRTEERRRRAIIVAIGLFGGAFLYGDGIITPAISVLGAVEGLEVASPALGRFVVPIAFLIIAALFSVQRFGTARVGGTFGWIMLVWFLTIGTLGVSGVAQDPAILRAVNPWYGLQFFLDHPVRSFVALGAVVLVVTGGEALYADMGHFGRKPIRLAWYSFVLPALLLNYFGQGTLVLQSPETVENPFFLLAPQWFRIPLLFIATSAAIVASQALISGAFSLTQQAVQLGFTPRMRIVHTSATQAGQIYIPEINKALAIGTLLLVVGFRSSTALGAAYGVAVTGTMAITTILFYIVTRQWGWPRWKALSFLVFFLGIDLAFFAANLLKIPHGGWVPLAVAVLVFTLMTTWARGRALLQVRLRGGSTITMDEFLESLGRTPPVRVAGTAVFMTSDAEGVPVVLLHHLKHNKVLHKTVILLSIMTEEVPEVQFEEKFAVVPLQHGFFRVTASYGFMESPDVKQIMAACAREGLNTKAMETSYYLGRERLIPVKESKRAATLPPGMKPLWLWRKKVFAFMSRNARGATEFFNIPPNRVVELGTQIEF